MGPSYRPRIARPNSLRVAGPTLSVLPFVAMKEVDRIVSMLEDDAIEKRIAAAIVLGELKAKGPEVTDGLMRLVESNVPALQRHGLDALARIGAKKVVTRLFPLLTTGADEVRRAAARTIASVGEEVVPQIKARLATAVADEHRALDAILADLGGKEAFTALLSDLSSDGETAKAAALAVRQRVKTADGAQRRSYLAETERFLKQQRKEKGTAS